MRAIFQVQASGGDLYLEGRFNRGFFVLRVWGAYTWRGLFSEFYGILYIIDYDISILECTGGISYSAGFYVLLASFAILERNKTLWERIFGRGCTTRM